MEKARWSGDWWDKVVRVIMGIVFFLLVIWLIKILVVGD